MSGVTRLLPLYAFMVWTGNILLFLFFSLIKTERIPRKRNIQFQGLKKRFPLSVLRTDLTPLPVLRTDLTPFTRGEIKNS